MSPEKKKQIKDFIDSLNKQEQFWTSGYLNGLLGESNSPDQGGQKQAAENRKITIAYGTESGNSKKLPICLPHVPNRKEYMRTGESGSISPGRFTKRGIFFNSDQYTGRRRTTGICQKFYDHIHQNGFELPKLKYGVLALGDTSYPMFCKAGEDVDHQLGHLGGKRIVDIQRCDVDFESDAFHWMNDVIQKLNGGKTSAELPSKTVKKSRVKKYTRVKF